MSADMMERMMDCGSMPMMSVMWVGMLFMALFWVALVVGVVLIVKWLIAPGGTSREDSALEILKKRYARGEITKQEFEERKRDVLS